ncbi:MAG: stage II sporulation protein M [Archaeoglobaceae archaeon]
MRVRIAFAALALLFVGSCYFGYFLAEAFPEVAKKEIENIRDLLQNVSPRNLPPLLIFLIILINNSVKSFFAMILGIFFGIVPILFLFFNGIIIGFFAKLIGEKIGILVFILLLLPHGIIEIPAVILACTYGFILGIEFVRDRKNIKKHLANAIWNYLRFVLPMLVVAAFIETALISIT